MRRGREDRNLVWKKRAFCLILIGAGMMILFLGLKQQIEPNIDAVSKLKARGIINQIINETIGEEFSGRDYEENLFIVEKGEDGQIQTVQSNTSLINGMVSGFAGKLAKRYEEMEPREIAVSYGTLLGSKLLSQTNLDFNIKVLPLSVTGYDFETEFEGQGINQTKYKIYITLDSSVRVLQPFAADTINIKSKVLIAEVVIVGEVPGSYVNVPKEDILDVT
ncbi:MAG: sporulation protein YunB [Emergencia sp.]|nr:sporulation protein YunB [Emergencia sp.]